MTPRRSTSNATTSTSRPSPARRANSRATRSQNKARLARTRERIEVGKKPDGVFLVQILKREKTGSEATSRNMRSSSSLDPQGSKAPTVKAPTWSVVERAKESRRDNLCAEKTRAPRMPAGFPAPIRSVADDFDTRAQRTSGDRIEGRIVFALVHMEADFVFLSRIHARPGDRTRHHAYVGR